MYEKQEPGFDDADDAVTYAPEIQSVEIPPDQLSQASSNFVDNFPDEHPVIRPSTPAHHDARPEEEQLRQLLQRSSPKPAPGPAPVPQAPSFEVQRRPDDAGSTTSSRSSRSLYKQSSLLSALGVTSMQEMLLELTSFEQLAEAMRKAGLERVNLIFGESAVDEYSFNEFG